MEAVSRSASWPGDAEIRSALLTHLIEQHGGDTDTAFIEELGLCRGEVFVDVTVVNGSLHGYEIKSDRDSLRRLQGQVMLYGRVLDHATIVVGDRHLADVDACVPDWWEVIHAHPSHRALKFTCVRSGRRNPAIDMRSLAELLWLDDAVALLAAHDALRGYRRRPRREIWDRVCQVCDIDEVARAVRDHLKGRATRRSDPPSS